MLKYNDIITAMIFCVSNHMNYYLYLVQTQTQGMQELLTSPWAAEFHDITLVIDGCNVGAHKVIRQFSTKLKYLMK